MRPSFPRRIGFTLLEVTLALAIGVLLMGAVYVAVDTQLRSAQTGRELVEQSAVARSLLTRMANEISSAANLSDPGRFRRTSDSSQSGQSGSSGSSSSGSSGSSGTSGSASSGSGSSTSGSTSGSSTSGSSSSTSGGSSSSSGQTSVIGSVTLPLGIVGDPTSIHIVGSRLSRTLALSGAGPLAASADALVLPPTSDLRRVSYWLAGGDNPAGLAWIEETNITNQDTINFVLPSGDDELQYVKAPEVKSLQFQYYDGTEWLDSWDSTTPGADGVTPLGPPRAVSITIGMLKPNRPKDAPLEESLRYHTHVVAIPTANGPTTSTQTSNGSTTGSTSGSSSGTSSSSGSGSGSGM